MTKKPTPPQTDTNDPVITQVQETLKYKAHQFYPQGTKPPHLIRSRKQIAVPQQRRATSLESTQPRHRRWHGAKIGLSVAAAVACIATAGALVVHKVGGRDLQVRVSNPSQTDGVNKSGTQLPANMKRTHDGPVRLVNFPFMCPAKNPGQSPNAPRSSADDLFTSTPVNPLEYCAKEGKLGSLNPERAVVTSSGRFVFLIDRPPGASTAPGGPEQQQLKSMSLPDGVTYNGLDFEVITILDRPSLMYPRKCPTFSEYVNTVNTMISDVPNSGWLTKTGPKIRGGTAQCHELRPNLATRTITILEAEGAAGKAAPPLGTAKQQKANAEFTREQEAVFEQVNTKCLTLEEAVASATKVIADSASPLMQGSTVDKTIRSGRNCARVYAHGRNFMVFG